MVPYNLFKLFLLLFSSSHPRPPKNATFPRSELNDCFYKTKPSFNFLPGVRAVGAGEYNNNREIKTVARVSGKRQKAEVTT